MTEDTVERTIRIVGIPKSSPIADVPAHKIVDLEFRDLRAAVRAHAPAEVTIDKWLETRR